MLIYYLFCSLYAFVSILKYFWLDLTPEVVKALLEVVLGHSLKLGPGTILSIMVLGLSQGLLGFPILSHFWNLFTGSLFNLASFSNFFFWRTFHIYFPLSISLKPRELRSSGFHLSSVPRTKPHAGTRAFSVAIPTLWNSLHEHVRTSNNIVSFRHHLKTHLLRLAYPS